MADVCAHVHVCLYVCIRGLEPVAELQPPLVHSEMKCQRSDWIRCCRSVCVELQFHTVGVNQAALSLSWISKQEIWQNSELLPAFFNWSCYGGYHGVAKLTDFLCPFPLSPVQ